MSLVNALGSLSSCSSQKLSFDIQYLDRIGTLVVPMLMATPVSIGACKDRQRLAVRGAPLPSVDGQIDPYARGVAALKTKGVASMATRCAKAPQDGPLGA